MHPFESLLQGGDLRSIGKANELVQLVNTSEDFASLVQLLFHHDRIIAMRAADTIEKVTLQHPDFLLSYSAQLLHLATISPPIELKWHLALLYSRLQLTGDTLQKAWATLSNWVINPSESKIVRVNALESLYQLQLQQPYYSNQFNHIIQQLNFEHIPSLAARVKKLKKCR